MALCPSDLVLQLSGRDIGEVKKRMQQLECSHKENTQHIIMKMLIL